MKKKLFYIIYSIFVVALLISSAETTAFFTAKFGPLTNLFTAGTVMINSGDASGELVVKNGSATWAPGDCKEVELTITNTGSKKAYVRARFEGAWQAAFHRNIASVNAQYSYTFGGVVYNGTVQSSSNPAYYYYGDFAGSGNIQSPCNFNSSSWFTAKDSPSPLYLSPASLATLNEGGYDLFSATDEDTSDSSEAQLQTDNSDDFNVLIDYINNPFVIELFLDNSNNDLSVIGNDEEPVFPDENNELNSPEGEDIAFFTTSSDSPTVNGLFYGDGDFERYNLIGTSILGSKLYSYMDGTTLYVALVVDPGVNDNVFDDRGTDYLKSAGWPGQGRHFGMLTDSEFAGFTLSCGDNTWSWQQGYLDQLEATGQGPNKQYDHELPTFYSDHTVPQAGSGAPPDCGPSGFQSSSSLVWNMNNYAEKYVADPNNIVDAWDVTLGGDRTTTQTWKSPYEDDFPNDVTKVEGYPTYSPQYGWEWAMVYEFSVDLSCCGADMIYLANISSHHSPSKTGPEDDLFPGIAIQKCVSVDGILPLDDPHKIWFCSPEWPELIGNDPAFKFVVTNTGDITLTNIIVTDDVLGYIDTIGSLEPGASSILYDIDDDWETHMVLPPGNFSIELCEDQNWLLGADGYFYYLELLEKGESVTLCVNVCLGEDPLYEGAEFILYTCVDAVQASHEAAFSEWGVGLVGGTWVEVTYNNTNDRWETEGDSHYWDGTTWVVMSNQ